MAISNKKKISLTIPKIAYAVFILLSIYFLVKHQYLEAASNLGLALIFDPFNQQQKWNDRPLYQRIWLLVHVVIVFGLFLIGLILH
jgi:hypothetical protein